MRVGNAHYFELLISHFEKLIIVYQSLDNE